MTSALEFSNQPEASPLIPKLVEDAMNHAQKITPKQVLPWGLPNYFKLCWVLGVLAILLGFVPYYHPDQRVIENDYSQNFETWRQKISGIK